MKINHDISLLEYNTFQIDEKADTVVEYDSVDELKGLIRDGIKEPVLHIGGGSNLLFLGTFTGTILKSRIKSIDVLEDNDESVLVRVGAGWVMDDFIAYSIEHGWYGQENLSLIPGQVGASAVQNIGAYGAEACDTIVNVHCISLADGTERVFRNEDCMYAYRYSIFKSDECRGKWAVTHVDYRLSKTFTPHLDYGGLRKSVEGISDLSAQKLRDVVIDIRKRKLPDPAVTGNAGSFFMNPIVDRTKYEEIAARYPDAPHYDVDANHVKVPAGWLIQTVGWKGRSLGRAAVHDRQALVLVNRGGAEGKDIQTLCNAVVADVKRVFGIELHPEVNFI